MVRQKQPLISYLWPYFQSVSFPGRETERESENAASEERKRWQEIMMEEERQKRGHDITERKRQPKLKKYDSWKGVENGTNWH